MAEEKKQESVFSPGERFIETFVAMKNGAVLDEVGERLKLLVEAVRETERAGALTVTFKVVPIAGTGDAVTVEADIREKIPRPSLGKTTFFTTAEGILTRENPRQLAFRMEQQPHGQ